MKKILFLLFFLSAISHATYVAVLETLADKGAKITRSEKSFLTDKLRERAGVNLPAYLGYTIMTSENIRAMLPPGKNIEDCEGSCLVETGRNIAADFVAQARIGNFNKTLTITFELYETASNKRIDGFTGRANSVDELLTIITQKADAVFQKINKKNSMQQNNASDGFSNFSTGDGYNNSFTKKYIVQIESNPNGALISVDGEPNVQCKQTPCSIQLNEGEHRISMVSEMYQKKDTILQVSKSTQVLKVALTPNFGELEIAPILTDNLGNSQDIKVTVDGSIVAKKFLQLSPGNHSIQIEHHCYEPIRFDVTINKSSKLKFDKPLTIALGGLELTADENGKPQSLPVYINGKQQGETPFAANVPVCSRIAIGNSKTPLPVTIKYHDNVSYIHKITKGYATNTPILSDPTFKDDGSIAASNFFSGQKIMEKMQQYTLQGTEKDKAKQVKEMATLLQKGADYYQKASENGKWSIPSKLQMGKLFYVMAERINNQKLNAKKEEERFAEQVGLIQQLTVYYEQARKIFQEAIIEARDKNIKNNYVSAVEEYYINAFYMTCDVFHQVASLFRNAPLPDSALVVREYVGLGMVKNDAVVATHEDLNAYRKELYSRVEAAKELAIPQCKTGIEAAQHYNIQNAQVEATKNLLRSLNKK